MEAAATDLNYRADVETQIEILKNSANEDAKQARLTAYSKIAEAYLTMLQFTPDGLSKTLVIGRKSGQVWLVDLPKQQVKV